MPRGTGTFDGDALRTLRQRRRISAARLGALVGTSKAMVLAYESGKHVPEAARVHALAMALGLPDAGVLLPWRHGEGERNLDQVREELGLSQEDFKALLGFEGQIPWRRLLDRPIPTIATLRRRRGLTVADMAAKTGIGLSTYRRIENEAMLPVRGRAGITTRVARVLQVPLTAVQTAIDHHPCAVRRQYDVAQLLATLMHRHCGQGKLPAVEQDDPDLTSLATLIRQPRGQVSRIVDQQLTLQQRRLKQKVQLALELDYPEGDEDDTEIHRRAAWLDNQIRQAPYRAAAHIAKFLCDGLTSRQWRSFTLIMERLTTSERPETTGVSEHQEPDLWPALMGRRHQGLPLIRESSPYSDPAPGPGKFYFITSAGFRYYEAARHTYSYLYPRVYAVPAPARREQHWRRAAL
ncbi:helix-turn-helix domain-containing protein [Streptomyces eurythermus]|uniref:helix-turn-helix domain-containing protein n=1 Tax=Streptomyces eurythermus TaxID=42237 RepID=UPI00340641AE